MKPVRTWQLRSRTALSWVAYTLGTMLLIWLLLNSGHPSAHAKQAGSVHAANPSQDQATSLPTASPTALQETPSNPISTPDFQATEIAQATEAAGVTATPTSEPLPTEAPTSTPTSEPSPTPTSAPTSNPPTASATATPPSQNATPTAVPTQAVTPTATHTVQPPATSVLTSTVVVTITSTVLPTLTTPAPTSTATLLPTVAVTTTATLTPTLVSSVTPAHTATTTATVTPIASATQIRAPAPTLTPTPAPTVISLPTASPTRAATATATSTPTRRPTVTATIAPISTSTPTPLKTQVASNGEQDVNAATPISPIVSATPDLTADASAAVTTSAVITSSVTVDPNVVAGRSSRGATPIATASEPSTRPIGLVYTTAQHSIGANQYLIAACIANIGEASASGVEVTFALSQSGARVVSLRAPSAPSEVSNTQARAIIPAIRFGQRMQLEVAVASPQPLLQDRLQVAVSKAYRLAPDDPTLPCEPKGSAAALVQATEAEFIIGGEVVNADQAAQVLRENTLKAAPAAHAASNPNFNTRATGLAISASMLLAMLVAGGGLTVGIAVLSTLRKRQH